MATTINHPPLHNKPEEDVVKVNKKWSSFWPSWMLREHIVAGPGYNRWLFPPAALFIQLCVGQVYAFSVFNKPLTKLCKHEGASCQDWDLVQVGWVLEACVVMVGCSTFLFGKQLDILGPRVAGLLAAVCWGGGWVISSIGVRQHNLALLFLGTGVIGGFGLGCGYTSPVSSLMKWFPDRPGLATGLAVMGFGGGAIIGAPLNILLMKTYSLSQVFLIIGAIDLVAMLIGAFSYRVPADDWMPAGWVPTTAKAVSSWAGYVDPNHAIKMPQFWLLWTALAMNITCGLAIIAQASLIVQDMAHVNAEVAGGIVGLLSLANILGRILWSTLSDKLGRTALYTLFFSLGVTLCMTAPLAADHIRAAFIFNLCLILSMYGGGFASVPAYIRDLFGAKFAGAIHGRILTAWSIAAVLGPYILNRIRLDEEKRGHPLHTAYNKTFPILAILLAVGFIANLLIPLANTYFPIVRSLDATSRTLLEMSQISQKSQAGPDEELGGSEEKEASREGGTRIPAKATPCSFQAGLFTALAWSIPLAGLSWGLFQCILKARKAF